MEIQKKNGLDFRLQCMIEEATHRQMWEIERWWWLFEVVPPVAQQPQSMAELTEGKDL